MGAWGTAVFSDDVACDVRDDYREYLGKGLSDGEATAKVLKAYAEQLDDSDDGPVVWLALAATQWKCGRLEPRVKRQALKIIASGCDLDRWDDDKIRKQRERVLSKLREQLESPQSAKKRIAKPFRDHCNWKVGQLVAYTLPSGNRILLRVIGFHSDKGGKGPICEILKWKGKRIPSQEKLRALGVYEHKCHGSQFLIGRTSERQLPQSRLEPLDIKLPPSQKAGGYTVLLWVVLDEYLEKWFRLK